jgi:hypothetical protein
MRFGNIQYYLCEFCGQKFGYIDDGQASEKEISDFQRNLLKEYCNEEKKKPEISKPIRSILAKFGIETPRGDSVKMYDPEWDRNVEGPGKIRARDNRYK